MSGDLKWNKIFGAGLGTAFVILLVQQGSALMYEPHSPKKMGYAVAIPEETAGGAEGPALLPDWGTVLPVADIAAGEAAFARCQACHTINAGGANGIGPNLNGVMGRAPGSVAGFAYSDAMTGYASESPVWSYDSMHAFIGAPQKVVSGTKMSFAGLKDEQTRINLIAYLRSQGSGGYAIPAPDPARAPGAAAGAAPAGAVDPNSATAAQPAGEAMGADAPVAGPGAAPTTQSTMPGQPQETTPTSPQSPGPR